MKEHTKITVWNKLDDEDVVIGWVHHGDGCENPACLRAVAEGSVYHATPRCGTLENYHFSSVDHAVQAVEYAFEDNMGEVWELEQKFPSVRS